MRRLKSAPVLSHDKLFKKSDRENQNALSRPLSGSETDWYGDFQFVAITLHAQ